MCFAVGSFAPTRRFTCFLFGSSDPFVSVNLVFCWPSWPWVPFVWFLRILHTSVLCFRSLFFETLVFVLFWIVTLLMGFVFLKFAEDKKKKDLKHTKLSFHSYLVRVILMLFFLFSNILFYALFQVCHLVSLSHIF